MCCVCTRTSITAVYLQVPVCEATESPRHIWSGTWWTGGIASIALTLACQDVSNGISNGPGARRPVCHSRLSTLFFSCASYMRLRCCIRPLAFKRVYEQTSLSCPISLPLATRHLLYISTLAASHQGGIKLKNASFASIQVKPKYIVDALESSRQYIRVTAYNIHITAVDLSTCPKLQIHPNKQSSEQERQPARPHARHPQKAVPTTATPLKQAQGTGPQTG